MTQIIKPTEEQLESLGAKGLVTESIAKLLNIKPFALQVGYELCYQVITNKDKTESNVIVVAVPSIEAITEFELDGKPVGENYIRESVRTKLLAKVASTFRNGSDNYPTTLADFVTARANAIAGSGMLEPFKEIAKSLCDLLRTKGLVIDVKSLRKCFESNRFATAMYPSIKPTAWDNMLKKLASDSESGEELFMGWLESRYNEKDVDFSDIDLDSII